MSYKSSLINLAIKYYKVLEDDYAKFDQFTFILSKYFDYITHKLCGLIVSLLSKGSAKVNEVLSIILQIHML